METPLVILEVFRPLRQRKTFGLNVLADLPGGMLAVRFGSQDRELRRLRRAYNEAPCTSKESLASTLIQCRMRSPQRLRVLQIYLL